MNARISGLYDLYAHSEDIQFLFISLDPERDSLDVLADYAGQFGAVDDRWRFATGELPAVQTVAEKSFLLSGSFVNHSLKYALVDPERKVRGYYQFDSDPSIESLKTDIKSLHQEFFNP